MKILIVTLSVCLAVALGDKPAPEFTGNKVDGSLLSKESSLLSSSSASSSSSTDYAQARDGTSYGAPIHHHHTSESYGAPQESSYGASPAVVAPGSVGTQGYYYYYYPVSNVNSNYQNKQNNNKIRHRAGSKIHRNGGYASGGGYSSGGGGGYPSGSGYASGSGYSGPGGYEAEETGPTGIGGLPAAYTAAGVLGLLTWKLVWSAIVIAVITSVLVYGTVVAYNPGVQGKEISSYIYENFDDITNLVMKAFDFYKGLNGDDDDEDDDDSQ